MWDSWIFTISTCGFFPFLEAMYNQYVPRTTINQTATISAEISLFRNSLDFPAGRVTHSVTAAFILRAAVVRVFIRTAFLVQVAAAW
jgi:hypothetical protein